MRNEVLHTADIQLSKLTSRIHLQQALETEWARSNAQKLSFGLILFSIDRFKLVNTHFGYKHADLVLQRIATITKQVLQRRGIVGRWGGDEFLCILADHGPASCYRIAEELRRTIETLAILIGSKIISVTSSFGVACYPKNGDSVKSLMTALDDALHQAKHDGRNRVVQAQDGELTIYQIGDLLETALREDRIMPAYQPIIDLRSGEKVAEEALARIITINDGVMAAQQFIDVASEFQLTHKIDRAIVLAALRRKLFHTHDDGKKCLFVNFSAGLLRHPEMVKELLDYIKQTSTAHNGQRSETKLVIEVTERELLENPSAAYQILKPFLDLGIRLALDDFGSGYSSFHYLADLPISFLKIDGNLIQRLDEPKVRAIVRGIQNTASELGLITLAECVETDSLAKHLIEIGINWGQGYHFSSVMLDEKEANTRRRMSANWAQGYYYRNPLIKGRFSSEQID